MGRVGHCMSDWAWERLLRKRDAAWDVAEEVSYASGFPFKDRNGIVRNIGQRGDISHQALARWCELRGIVYR